MENIKFNGGIFNVTEYDEKGDISEIQRTTEPKIKVETHQDKNTLKLRGWTKYKPFKFLK